MSSMLEAVAVYRREHCTRSFEQDLLLHSQHGYVFNEAAFFIMGRPVRHDAPAALIVNPEFLFPAANCDCWHVYLAAGDLSRAWDMLPYPLPWLSFERKNELRFYEAKRIREHCLR